VKNDDEKLDDDTISPPKTTKATIERGKDRIKTTLERKGKQFWAAFAGKTPW